MRDAAPMWAGDGDGEVVRIWSGRVARGGLGALPRLVAAGSRPRTPGWRRGTARSGGGFGQQVDDEADHEVLAGHGALGDEQGQGR